MSPYLLPLAALLQMIQWLSTTFNKRSIPTTAIVCLYLCAPVAYSQQGGPAPVDVAKPLVEKIVDWDEFTGRFNAVERVEIRPRVSGYLEEITFKDGQLVEKGDVLFKIDPRPVQAVLDSANAELGAAQAAQRNAAVDFKRSQELSADGDISVSVLDSSRAAKLQADAQVTIAEAAIRSAQLNVDFTEITSPLSGRISDAKVSIGSLVVQNDTTLATVVTIDPIYLEFTGSEADFLKYSRLNLAGKREISRTAANAVEARLSDESGWPHKGKMNFVDNELDQNAGTIRGRAIFDNPDQIFLPGLFARLRLIASQEYEALLVPDAAILADQNKKVVLTVNAEGEVSQKAVQPGPLHKGLRVVRSGIAKDDLIVVSGVQRARPGQKVKANETTISTEESASN